MTENTRLRRYYETLGFHHEGDISGDNHRQFPPTLADQPVRGEVRP